MRGEPAGSPLFIAHRSRRKSFAKFSAQIDF